MIAYPICNAAREPLYYTMTLGDIYRCTIIFYALTTVMQVLTNSGLQSDWDNRKVVYEKCQNCQLVSE